jgi:OPT oligopeptide transporter protein
MPLAAGFVGVVPALSHLSPADNPPLGPVLLPPLQLSVWALVLAFFGVFLAVPIREQVIEREALQFPSGTATAQVIRTLVASDAAGAVLRGDGAIGEGSTAETQRRALTAPRGRRSMGCRTTCRGGSTHLFFAMRAGSCAAREQPMLRKTLDLDMLHSLSTALDDDLLSAVRLLRASGRFTQLCPSALRVTALWCCQTSSILHMSPIHSHPKSRLNLRPRDSPHLATALLDAQNVILEAASRSSPEEGGPDENHAATSLRQTWAALAASFAASFCVSTSGAMVQVQ